MIQKLIAEIRDELCKDSTTDLLHVFINGYIDKCIFQNPLIKNIIYGMYAVLGMLFALLVISVSILVKTGL